LQGLLCGLYFSDTQRGGFFQEVFAINAVTVGVSADHTAVNLIIVTDGTDGVGASVVTGCGRGTGRTGSLRGAITGSVRGDGWLGNIPECDRHDAAGKETQMLLFRTCPIAPLLLIDRIKIDMQRAARFSQNDAFDGS